VYKGKPVPDESPPAKTVLVVEDDAATRALLEATLREAGYAVVPAANGLEALAILRAGPPPDLILLDMLMPVLDGWHFLGRLMQLWPPGHVPILITTATTILTREWAEAHGCAGCLRKPVEVQELLAEVRRCLGG
jgi:CheY-like chemotaxis protein